MTTAVSLNVSQQTLLFLLPEITLIGAATAIITLGAFLPRTREFWASLAGGSIALACFTLYVTQAMLTRGPALDPYVAVVNQDWLSTYGRIGLLFTGLIVLALAHNQVDKTKAAEFFGALLFINAGAMIVISSNELVLLFLGLELVSIPTYLLLYLPRRTASTREATAKYFYLSIFSSGLLLFGLAYIYGLCGLSNLKSLQYVVHWSGRFVSLPQPQFATIALLFVMAGLGFKVAAVPFHFYAPDVYEGSPTVLAALLAWVPKAIGFVSMLRVLTAVFGWEPTLVLLPGQSFTEGDLPILALVSNNAVTLTWILAVATLILGNTVALAQTNLKRLLAYSSIAHAGYLLVGVAAAFRNAAGGAEGVLGADAVFFYLATYALMTLGAFGVLILLNTRERPIEQIDDLSGLIWTNPWASLALVLCLFSLAGIPPMAGFWGKFRIFQAALEVARGDDARPFLLLCVIGVLSAAIGAFYYLRLIVIIIFREPATPAPLRAAWPTAVAIGVCAGLSLWFGVLPGSLANISHKAGQAVVTLPEPATAASERTASR